MMMLTWRRLVLFPLFIMAATSATTLRNIMYLTGQHPVIPEDVSLRSPITHVALAFMNSNTFNREEENSSWPIFMSVEEARAKFEPGTKIMVAIGGWGDTAGFDTAARTEESRARFARNVASMVRDTGADGVDIDWEYPGGNGEDYKQIPNSEKAWEITAYPLLLAAIRAALGPDKLISAAVPGIPRDMLAFTSDTLPQIMQSLDFLNVMTYDLMNRRDTVTKHHTGVRASLASLNVYMSSGAPPENLNLGFAFYVKYFRTEGSNSCMANPIGCPTGLMEDPATGADLGKTGGFSYHDDIPHDEIWRSYENAVSEGRYDEEGGGYWYYDADQALWWTFDTPDAIARKFPLVVQEKNLGGVFAWGLGEDAPAFKHLSALNDGVKRLAKVKDEL
ncbi:glycoside hydrolase family 18 protein [Xylaria bambusicola]|uniref:glycoside hydrolase family 18 protein n=1 Tax=Xylaria bambusicola TaxID=326684 RepID=UPI0020073608|nr:glycoside hydrolase family 18 protein [Xylaria bambusicola]KAI0506681.1 glycoside hydrolase family 18 protein [Xylaria bambusicola]